MNKKNLADIIINNLKFLNFKEDFYADNEKILKYFLEKDVITIFGKKDFQFDLLNPEKNEIEIDKYTIGVNKRLIITFMNKEYVFQNHNDSLIIMNNETVLAIISYDKSMNFYQNTLINNLNLENQVNEVQRISMGREIYFEYLKTIESLDGKIEYPPIKMKPMYSKRNDIEYFELISLQSIDSNDNIIKKMLKKHLNKYIVEVQTSYQNESILNYLNKIYKIMEEYIKSEEKKQIKNIGL